MIIDQSKSWQLVVDMLLVADMQLVGLKEHNLKGRM